MRGAYEKNVKPIYFILGGILLLAVGGYLLFFTGGREKIVEEKVESKTLFGYTKNGVLFCVDDILRFADAKSGNCVVLCDKPNCQHSEVQDDIDKQTCNAVVPMNAFLPTIYHNKLYFVYRDGVNKVRVYKADSNGGNRSVLAYLDNVQFVYNGAYEGNYLLCAYSNNYDYGTEELNGLTLEKPITGLAVIDLETGKVIRVPEKVDYGATIFKQHYDKDRIYYGCLSMDIKIDYEKLDLSLPESSDYVDQHLFTSIWCYDLNTGEDTCIYTGQDYQIKDFSGHYAYLIKGALDTTQIYEFNLETGEQTLLVNEANITNCMVDSDRLAYVIMNGSETIFKYYDLTKKEITLIGKRNSTISPIAIIEDKVYVSYNDNEELCFGYIPREDYYTNNFDSVLSMFYPNTYGN